ncbi:MAG: hypothetical protein Q8J65_04660, partial [Nitrosomonadales bacterium]|nr:hypothetical protein [Nitrosomonadales bacterium]
MYFSPAQLPPPESERLFLSFGLALCLHVCLFLVLPNLKSSPELIPMRIEAQMAQMRQVTAPSEDVLEPEPPKPVVQQKPVQKPREITKQILTAKDDAPPTPD